VLFIDIDIDFKETGRHLFSRRQLWGIAPGVLLKK
jgi:hypothetical protein